LSPKPAAEDGLRDPAEEPVRARKAWDSHLARAKWLVEQDYEHLLRGGTPH
jgi:hypothetical protein